MERLSGILLLSILSTGVFADTYWLNIAGNFDSVSYPSMSVSACEKSQVEYARLDGVYYVSCDIEPLPTATNLSNKSR